MEKRLSLVGLGASAGGIGAMVLWSEEEDGEGQQMVIARIKAHVFGCRE